MTEPTRNATYGEIRSDPDFRWERIHDKTELEAFYRRIIPAISAAAREYGYAIGVHGSLQRDLDLIAAPWREGACDHETLARVVHKAACGLVSESYTWEVKPGGRYACSFPVCWTEKSETFKRETSLGCIDLSVMPFVTLSEKAMSKIVEASAPQIEEAARNMAKAAVIGVGVGPLPSALSAGASSTPRTDAQISVHDEADPAIGGTAGYNDLVEHARDLERELAEVRAALSVATADAGQVAMMLLQNDRDGAMQWARDIELEWKTDGSPRLKLRATAMPSATGGTK